MKKLAVVLMAFAMTGVPAYLWVVGSVLGVSPKNPLGEFALIDAWLTEQGFEKSEREADAKTRKRFAREFAGAVVLIYKHGYQERMDVRNSVVAIALSASGQVVGVAGSFRSGAEDMGVPGSRGESFLGMLWIEAAGKRPTFVDDQRGRGRFAQQVRVATFDLNGVKGNWLKSYAAAMDARSIGDRVTLHIN